MKRTKAFMLPALLIFVAVMVLAGCSGKKESSSSGSDGAATSGENSQPASQGSNNTPGGSNNASNTSTVEGVLAEFNIKVDDVKPAETTSMETKNSSTSTGVIFYMENIKLSQFDFNAYLEKLVGVVKSVSDDGKLYNHEKLIFGTKEELEIKYAKADAWMFATQWGFLYQNNSTTITIGIGPDTEVVLKFNK